MNKGAEKKKSIYDSVKISQRSLDIIIFTLALATMCLIIYAIVVSA